VASLLDRLRNGKRDITTLEDYASALNQFVYNGHSYGLGGNVQQTLQGEQVERISNNLESFARSAYAANGVVFACMAVRQLVFSAVRFQYQRFNRGRPGDMWRDQSLEWLDEPWIGGTTQDLLSRMIQDADLAGNFYGVKDTPISRVEPEIVRLRPDWVDIVLQPRMMRQENGRAAQVGWRRIGYAYWEYGQRDKDPAVFLPEDMTHFAPHPDPLATYRGMACLTPVVREIEADSQMTRHKQKFIKNGATPNMVVTGITAPTQELFDKIVAGLRKNYEGPENAGRIMGLAAGSDAKVVGANFEGMDFKSVQGAGETRIAAAFGVPPSIVGLSEGLQGSSLNAGNYSAARRRFADGTLHPLWQNAAGSLQRITGRPSGNRLWYDARDVPFLREDEKDTAEIQRLRAVTIRNLTDAGWEPDAAVLAVDTDDMSVLKGQHSGLFSVQLQKPGETNSNPAVLADDDEPGSADDE
jgi:phage portal protein BeeE